MTLIAISHYIEAIFDYGYFVISLCGDSKILHKKFQVISSKNEDVTLIFPIQNEIEILKNRRHAFIFGRNDLRFFCGILESLRKKDYKIAIVKFFL